MAIQHGIVGKTLKNNLFRVMAIPIALGLLVALPIVVFFPTLAAIAWLPLLVGIMMVFGDKQIARGIRATRKGYEGEAQMGKALANLPEGWRVFHDLDLGGENVDHLAVGPAGVFNLEVKNYSGKVIATPKGLWNKGQKQDKIVKQAWRQSHKLRELLEVEVVPILVFVGHELEGNRVGRLMVMHPKQAVEYLRTMPKAWDYKEFLEVVRKAEKLVK
jgi:hypothetical protein